MSKKKIELARRLAGHLERLYPDSNIAQLTERLMDLISTEIVSFDREAIPLWDEQDVILITYGDTVRACDQAPLAVLNDFLDQYLDGVFSTVHLLPFFPFSSDDGFAVIDYLTVNPALGDWEDVRQLGRRVDLMFDLVINHVSSHHCWFRQFRSGQKPGCHYFIQPPDDADLSHVVRPRESPLLLRVATRKGEKKVWTTFSPDQIDVNFSNPDTLFEYVRILLYYVACGARFVRLDAIAFLWKEWGTSCLNLPQTHECVRLLRSLLSAVKKDLVLLTETNVPHQQNISYFGNGDEAHMVYQFSLSPLLLHGLYRGTSRYLTDWARTCCLTPPGTTYLNFTASHDGIGVRPLEGLLSPGEIEVLLRGMVKFGGRVSFRSHSDGTKSPYEINITYFDALKGTWLGQDCWQISRFLLAQTLMLGLRGIPAIYIHSLLATENDTVAVRETGRARTINRHNWFLAELKERLKDPYSNNALVFTELRRRIIIRKKQKAFHPDARQEILFLGEHFFGLWRHSLDGRQKILVIHNLTDREQTVYIDGSLDGQLAGQWADLISGESIPSHSSTIRMPPYHSVWLTEMPGK